MVLLTETHDHILDGSHTLAFEIAGRMAALPPLAVRLTKRAINHGLLQRVGEVLDLSLAYEEATLASDDLLEAIAAFQERRPGTYRGR